MRRALTTRELRRAMPLEQLPPVRRLPTRLTLRPPDAPRDTSHEDDNQDDPHDHVKRSVSAIAPRVHKPLMCKAPHDLFSLCNRVTAYPRSCRASAGPQKVFTVGGLVGLDVDRFEVPSPASSAGYQTLIPWPRHRKVPGYNSRAPLVAALGGGPSKEYRNARCGESPSR